LYCRPIYSYTYTDRYQILCIAVLFTAVPILTSDSNTGTVVGVAVALVVVIIIMGVVIGVLVARNRRYKLSVQQHPA